MEWLDIVDEQGNPTGKTVLREEAHRLGIRHRTSHVWLVRKGSSGQIEILLQRRSEDKDSHPDCYDISSAGHIPAGTGYTDSAIRELQEELGVTASAETLHYCGQRRISYDAVFYGKDFKDRQVSNVYYMWCDKDAEAFQVQKEEVSCVRWMALEECMEAVKNNTIKHCIIYEELLMVKRGIDGLVADQGIIREEKTMKIQCVWEHHGDDSCAGAYTA